MTEDDLQRVISRSSNASCQLDPEPTWLLKEHLESHLTALALVVNHSLTSGIFPVNAHSAMISPLLKNFAGFFSWGGTGGSPPSGENFANPPPHPTLVPVFGPRLVPPSRGSSPKI